MIKLTRSGTVFSGSARDLSTELYSGGILQFRARGSGGVLSQVANTGFGNGVLFQLMLEHRVTDVEGMVPKTAFAGWFKSHPLHAELRKTAQSLCPARAALEVDERGDRRFLS